MTLSIGTASGVRDATEIHIGTASGAKPVLEGWIGTADGMRKFYSATPALTVTASPDQIGWQVINPGSYYISSGAATATPAGGTPPYSYSWTTDNGSATVDNDTAATTGFQSSDGYSATATCTVTDANGDVAQSNPVSLV